MRPRIQWPQESIDYLRANYATNSSRQLAVALGVSHPTLFRKMKQLGLTGSGKTKPRAAKAVRQARTAKVGLCYGAVLPSALQARLAAEGIDATTYAEALDAFAAKNIHPFIRPWQLVDKRYYEGRVVAQDGSLHYTQDKDTWHKAADACIHASVVILQKRRAGGWL